MIDKKTKGKIINALRKLTYTHSPRNNAKNKQKVAPATFQCEQCEVVVYTGSKELEKANLSEFDHVIKGKVCLDHRVPVIDPKGFKNGPWDWNEYIERMFCDEDGFQVLCTDCHDKKTEIENLARKKYRQAKKDMIS